MKLIKFIEVKLLPYLGIGCFVYFEFECPEINVNLNDIVVNLNREVQ